MSLLGSLIILCDIKAWKRATNRHFNYSQKLFPPLIALKSIFSCQWVSVTPYPFLLILLGLSLPIAGLKYWTLQIKGENDLLLLMVSKDSFSDSYFQGRDVMVEGHGRERLLSSCWLGNKGLEEFKRKGPETDHEVSSLWPTYPWPGTRFTYLLGRSHDKQVDNAF